MFADNKSPAKAAFSICCILFTSFVATIYVSEKGAIIGHDETSAADKTVKGKSHHENSGGFEAGGRGGTCGRRSRSAGGIVGGLDKQQRGRVHGQWPKGERWFALADCLSVLGKDQTRLGWPAATRACNSKVF